MGIPGERQSLSPRGPKKAGKSSDTPEGDVKPAGRSERQDRGTKAGSGPLSSFMERLWNMLPGGPTEKETQTVSEERESSRLPIAIPVTLFGRDESGRIFREATKTLDISRRGAKILTRQHLQTDAHIWIENAGVQRTSIAKVVHKGKRVDPKEATEICVKVLEVLDPERIWGIEAPPKDWIRGLVPPSDAQRLEYLLAVERLANPEVLSSRAIATTVPEGIIKKEPQAPAGLLDAETLSSSSKGDARAHLQSASAHPGIIPPQSEEAGEALPTVLSEAKEISRIAPQSSGSQGLADRTMRQLEEQAQKILHEIDTAKNSIPLAEEQARARLQAAVAEMESTHAARAEIREKRMVELSSAAEGLQEQAAESLKKYEGDLRNTLQAFQQEGSAGRAELETAAQGLLESLKDKLQGHADGAIAALGEKARQTVATTAEKGREQVARMQEVLESLGRTAGERFDERLTAILKHAETASRTSEAAKNRINHIADQAVKRLEAAEKKTKDDFLEWGDRFESRLAGFLTSMEGLARQSETLHRDFQDKLEPALQDFLKRKATQTSDLQEVFNDLAERVTGQLNKQAEAAIEKLKEEAEAVVRPIEEGRRTHMANVTKALESAARAATELHAERLAQASAEHEERARLRADEVINSLNRASEDAVTRLKAVQEQTETRFAALIDAHEKYTAEILSKFEDLEKRSVATPGETPRPRRTRGDRRPPT
jgi:hypothetical protein